MTVSFVLSWSKERQIQTRFHFRDANCILFMENGNIIEQGTHKELLEKGGAYAALYNSQFA